MPRTSHDDQPRRGAEEDEPDPLPEADLEEAELEERRRQHVARAGPSRTPRRGRDDARRCSAAIFHTGGPARLRARARSGSRPARRGLDGAERVAERRQAVVGSPSGWSLSLSRSIQSDAVEDGLELARQLRARGCARSARGSCAGSGTRRPARTARRGRARGSAPSHRAACRVPARRRLAPARSWWWLRAGRWSAAPAARATGASVASSRTAAGGRARHPASGGTGSNRSTR